MDAPGTSSWHPAHGPIAFPDRLNKLLTWFRSTNLQLINSLAGRESPNKEKQKTPNMAIADGRRFWNELRRSRSLESGIGRRLRKPFQGPRRVRRDSPLWVPRPVFQSDAEVEAAYRGEGGEGGKPWGFSNHRNGRVSKSRRGIPDLFVWVMCHHVPFLG